MPLADSALTAPLRRDESLLERSNLLDGSKATRVLASLPMMANMRASLRNVLWCC